MKRRSNAKKETWRFLVATHLGTSKRGLMLLKAKRAGKEYSPKDLPAYVMAYLSAYVGPGAGHVYLSSVRTLEDLKNLGPWDSIGSGGRGRLWIQSKIEAPKKPSVPHEPIAEFDSTTADTYGDDENTVYVNVGRKGKSGGWYVTAVIDSEHFTDDLVKDRGPYKTEKEARYEGKTVALDWCETNEVDCEPEERENRGRRGAKRRTNRRRASGRRPGRKSNPMTIKTDNKWHEFLDRSEVPAKVLKSDFDWVDPEDSEYFLKYKDNYHHLSEFETVKVPGWDGAFPESHFSGLLLKVSPDQKQYKIAYYYE